MRNTNSFSLLNRSDVRRLIVFFFASDLFFVCAFLFLFLHGNPLGSERPDMFNMDGEGNIPSWYSSMKLLSVGLCAYFYGRLVYPSDRLAGVLILLAAMTFAFLSMDEGAVLHEKFGDRLDLYLTDGVGPRGTMFAITGLWMLFFAPPVFAVLIAGIIFLRKRLSIPTHVFVKAILGIVIFIGSAAPGDILLNYVTGDARTIQIAIEEYGEMTGVTLILWAVMTLLAGQNAIVVGDGAGAGAKQGVRDDNGHATWGRVAHGACAHPPTVQLTRILFMPKRPMSGSREARDPKLSRPARSFRRLKPPGHAFSESNYPPRGFYISNLWQYTID